MEPCLPDRTHVFASNGVCIFCEEERSALLAEGESTPWEDAVQKRQAEKDGD